jgi:hypothetical protein
VERWGSGLGGAEEGSLALGMDLVGLLSPVPPS